MYLLEYELPVAKSFPAGQYGGLNSIKALSASFPNMRFMPTGRVNPKNILEYLSNPKVIACGGSWMVKDIMIDNHQFGEIQGLMSEAVQFLK